MDYTRYSYSDLSQREWQSMGVPTNQDTLVQWHAIVKLLT